MSSNKFTISTLNEELLIHFPKIGSEAEGYLAVAEVGKTCPFPILRNYWVYGCPDAMQRGGHAHHTMHQLLVCLSGTIEVILDNGKEKKSFILDNPTVGLHQMPLVWGDLIYPQNSVLLVMASTLYFAEDYIRDYQEFLQIVNTPILKQQLKMTDSPSIKPTVSIVIPLYYAEKILPNLINSLENLSDKNQDSFDTEIVFVDDGSQDNTFDIIRTIKPRYFKFQAIRLARNFKSYIAILAGIQSATGDYITCLPQDLQEPPELVNQLWSKSQEDFDVVWAVRQTRSDPILEQIFSNLFHRLMHRIWADWPETGADMFMIAQPVAKVILSMQEKNSHITGQILWSGFRQTRIFYNRQQRKSGKSGWSFWKKVELAISVITQFSYLPIRLCTALGILLASAGFIYGLAIAIGKFTLKIAAPGWSALMIVVLILGGFQLIFLGIIGEYLWRIFDEVRKRPAYIVREKI